MRIISAVFLMMLVGAAGAQTITGISGTVADNSVVTISGSAFGTNSTAAPVVWDNLEDGSCNLSATVGSWSTVNDLSISTANNRHPNSSYNAGVNFTSEAWGSFTGGSDSPKWFVQYWFYLDDDFDFGTSISNNLGNLKIFRLWSTASSPINNLRVQLLGSYDSDLVVGNVDHGHDWSPVTSEGEWINYLFGHANPGYVDGGNLGWREYENDITTGSWHLFQFQYQESDVDVFNGKFKWWMDGKLLVETDEIKTRETGQTSSFRPHTVGFYNSHGANADGNDHFHIDDAYIDNGWARVELGNSPTYDSCTHREVQIPSDWETGSITIRMNLGSFSAEDTYYLFVIDEEGHASDGFLVSEVVEGPGRPGTPVQSG